MGQKVHPIGFRLGVLNTWSSRWYATHAAYRLALQEDVKIRRFLKVRLKEASVAKVDVERSANAISVIVITAKPGVVIGRGGQGIEQLTKEIKEVINNPKANLQISIQEI